MHVAPRPYVLAGAALAATSVIIVTPLATKAIEVPVRTADTQLLASDILNVPINLFYDLANIPDNLVQQLGTSGDSLLYSGDWWVPDSTNLWGIDPGDTTHVAALFGFIPFPAFTQGAGGLEYQIDGLLAAELPVSASCDAETCAPMTPADVITGSTGIDRNIGFLESLSGQNGFGLFDHWFQVPLSNLMSGYTFSPTNDPGVIDPSGPASSGFGFVDGGSNPFIGGTVGADNAMPWDGLTYTLNPLQPFQNFWESLMATPSTTGVLGTGIDIPTFTEIVNNLQTLMAGTVVAFDPFVAGSPACPALCDIPNSLQIPALVQDIQNLDPGSPDPAITEWLANAPDNNATTTQTEAAIALLQTGIYNLTPAQLATVDADLASINPELPALLTNAGIYTDPGYEAFAQAITADPTSSPAFDPVYGGLNSNLVLGDLVTLLTNNDTNWSELSNPAVLGTLLDPLAAAASPGAATDLSSLLGSFDPTAFSTELSNLLSSSFDPTTLATDLTSMLDGVFGASLGADLASGLLGLF